MREGGSGAGDRVAHAPVGSEGVDRAPGLVDALLLRDGEDVRRGEAVDGRRPWFEVAPSLTERDNHSLVLRERSSLEAVRDRFDARHCWSGCWGERRSVPRRFDAALTEVVVSASSGKRTRGFREARSCHRLDVLGNSTWPLWE